ncbi:MAG: serine hydrolase [Clostridia bacterium]|nr:serine hydrolase [Clostridia bacterium]
MTDKLFMEASPESVGISSESIQYLIEDFKKHGFFMHGVLLVRYGKVVAEGYYAPFKKEDLHRIYSVSKTFTATAIGLLIDEGKLSLDDCVYKFFPDKCPENLHRFIKEATIRDLLMMSTPFSTGGTYNGAKPDKDWEWTFFNAVPDYPAGTMFTYDTSGTHILGAIVERVSKKSLLEYLKDKVLREIGFSEDARCIKAPEGTSWGGSGVICSLRDMARLGYLYMNKGKIGEKQYLSENYIKQATSKQIDNCPYGHENCYRYGYGYKVWITRENSFSFMGMGDQYVICLPEKDFMFVCTADNQGNPSSQEMIYELLWKNVVDKLSDTPLKENKEENEKLNKKLSNLKLFVPSGKSHSLMEKEIAGAKYALSENPMQISDFTLKFWEDHGSFCYTTPRGEKEICFGYGEYRCGEFPETHYSGDTIGIPANRSYRCVSSGAWTEEKKLVIRVNITDDYLGNLTISLGFKDNEVTMFMFKTAEWFLKEYHGFATGRTKNDL